MTRRMPIGEFAKLTHLSVRALRHYHETKVLIPAFVDPSTGYRQYEHSQAHRAHLVRRLREADMSLDDIVDLLGASGDRSRRVAAHADELTRRARELSDIADALRASLAADVTALDIVRQELPAQPALVVTAMCGLDDIEEVCRDSFAQLDDAAVAYGSEVAGPGTASFANEVFESVGAVACTLPVEVLPTRPLPNHVSTGETPNGVFLTATHAGDISEIGVTYSALGTHVNQLGVAAPRPVVERYIVADGAPSDLRTEVCWPVFT